MASKGHSKSEIAHVALRAEGECEFGDVVSARSVDNEKEIVVAIWGMESAYGAILEGNSPLIKPVIRSLATLAYQGGSRQNFGRQQLIAALKILQNGDVTLAAMEGSWAGAMGHTQFIPTSYLAYAVDFDGDGKRNVWTSEVDALASTANYLQEAGWNGGETWGYEVRLPAGLSGDHRRAPGRSADAGPDAGGPPRRRAAPVSRPAGAARSTARGRARATDAQRR